jgi:hypothetical protein
MTPNERLLRVADLLDNVERHVFTMSTWSVGPASQTFNFTSQTVAHLQGVLAEGPRLDAYKRSRIMGELQAAGHCGFAGCAVGHATQDPVLRAEGLKLDGLGFPGLVGSPYPDNVYPWRAVEKFFDLTAEESELLFDIHSYSGGPSDISPYDPPPQEVAARIREFVASRSAA